MSRNAFRLFQRVSLLALIIGLIIRHLMRSKKYRVLSFSEICDRIINKIEGGYFHPDMLNDGRIKFSGTREEIADKKRAYENSGETLYGIDRKNLVLTDSEFVKFWLDVDRLKLNKVIRKWNNFPNKEDDARLRLYLYSFMNRFYLVLSKRFLTDKAQTLLNSSDALTVQMIYATWNGSGWFQRFAKLINENSDMAASDVYNLIQRARLNATGPGSIVIRQGAPKIDSIL